jgi:hypothetical protein
LILCPYISKLGTDLKQLEAPSQSYKTGISSRSLLKRIPSAWTSVKKRSLLVSRRGNHPEALSIVGCWQSMPNWLEMLRTEL